MDLMERLVQTSLDVQPEDLPQTALRATKHFLLDTFGVAAAAARSPESKVVTGLLRRWGGAPESTLWFTGEKGPGPAAALLNGTLIHSQEFDCTHSSSVHPMSSVTAATLAVAEQVGGISGRDFRAAVIVGADLACRVGMGCRKGLMFYRPATCGAFGAVAACARLSQMGLEQTMDAIGVLYSQQSGTLLSHSQGSLVNTMQPGFAARSAVLSINLAQEGMGGPRDVLEGKYGYYQLFEGGDYDTKPVLAGLGDSYEVENLRYKPFPSGSLTHGAVEAAIRLRNDHGVKPQEIQGVTVTAPELNVRLVGRPPVKGAMTTQGARLCLPLCVAVALLRGDVWVTDFEGVSLEDDNVYELASRIEVVVNPDIADPNVSAPVFVEVRTKEGTIREETIYVSGSPGNPMTEEQRLKKFRRCWENPGTLSTKQGERLIKMIDNLEEVENVGELIDLLAPAVP